MAIISISGKIGSGKDTAASLIQQITPYHNWQVKKFAGKLKQIASLLTGVPVELFEDQEFKKLYMPEEWDYFRPVTSITSIEQYDYPELVRTQMTYRDFLQKLGTESMRDGLHENVWINALFSEYRCKKEKLSDSLDVEEYESTYPNWIITDTRFPNELEAVKRYNGITIKIVRNTENILGIQHVSETSLDHIEDWDYIIDNNGTLDELKQKIFEILSKESLVKYSSL